MKGIKKLEKPEVVGKKRARRVQSREKWSGKRGPGGSVTDSSEDM